MQYYFVVSCIGYLFVLQKIFYHKKMLIVAHAKIGTEITEVPPKWIPAESILMQIYICHGALN